MDKDIINAIARLRQADAEHSRVTKKLHKSAAEVALLIIKACPVDVDLPRGYRVVKVQSNLDREYYLIKPGSNGKDTQWIDGEGRYLHGDFGAWVPAQSRTGSLQFATDVAGGLLDEISAWLEERIKIADDAAEVLSAIFLVA